MTSHRIAIILADEIEQYGNYEKVIERCTDFATVSHEEYLLLIRNKSRLRPDGSWERYEIVEVPENSQDWVTQMLPLLLAETKAAEEAKRKAKEKSEEARRRSQAQNEAKARENKLKQLQKLKQELGFIDADEKVPS